MDFELKYLKYKAKYLALKKQAILTQGMSDNGSINAKYLALKKEIYGGDNVATATPTLTPIFTEESKPEPTPTPDPKKAEIPKFGKIEWNIDPEQPRNLRNNTSVKLTKPNGESFIVREGDYINYVSKSGFNPPKTGELIPLDPNNPNKHLPRQVGRQLGYVRSILDINNEHTGPPTAIEVYRQHYDTRVFDKHPTHKTFRFDHVSLYKPKDNWIPGTGP